MVLQSVKVVNVHGPMSFISSSQLLECVSSLILVVKHHKIQITRRKSHFATLNFRLFDLVVVPLVHFDVSDAQML